MLVTKEIEIDMGHRVTNHKSKCASLHGHRYKIEVGVDGRVINEKGISDEGMVIDFGDLKQIMMEVLDKKFDHGFVIWEGDPMVEYIKGDLNTKTTVVPFIPTAENLAKYWFEMLDSRLLMRDICLQYVKVFETPTSTALYTRDDMIKDSESSLRKITKKELLSIIEKKEPFNLEGVPIIEIVETASEEYSFVPDMIFKCLQDGDIFESNRGKVKVLK